MSETVDEKAAATRSRWDEAIADAERMIREAKERLKKLRAAVRTFERLRDEGVPFPGEKP